MFAFIRQNFIQTLLILIFVYICAESIDIILRAQTIAENNQLLVAFFALAIIGILYSSIYAKKLIATQWVIGLLLYAIYFLIRCYYDDEMGFSTETISNIVWIIIAITGFTIGYKTPYHYIHTLSAIIVIGTLTLSLPELYNQVFNKDSGNIDAYFIFLFQFPLISLIKNPTLKNILLAGFIFLGIISGKRTIVILMCISIVIIFYYKIKNNPMLIFLIAVFIGLLVAHGSIGDNEYISNVTSRMNSISSDGGSGRTDIYKEIFISFDNFILSDWIFGRGRYSVHQLVGIDAHCDILQVLHSCGIIGLIIYLHIFNIARKAMIKAKRLYLLKQQDIYHAILIALMIIFFCSLFNCLIFNPIMMSISFFVFSYIIGITEQQTHKLYYRL